MKINFDKLMKIDFSKLNKVTLPIAILIAGVILGSFYFATQVNKQHSIEKQQELQLEQEHKEYIAKRKSECYNIYLQEKKTSWNVEDYFYREKGYGLLKDDVCEIQYRNYNWKEGDPLEKKYFTREH